MRCGDGLDHGAGRLIIVRSMYSLPTAGGNWPIGEMPNVEVRAAEYDRGDLESLDDLESDGSRSSSDTDILDCFHTYTYTRIRFK